MNIKTIGKATAFLFDSEARIALWAEVHDGEKWVLKCFWKEQAYKLPKVFQDAKIHKIIGVVPEKIEDGDVINILIKTTSPGFSFKSEYITQYEAGNQELLEGAKPFPKRRHTDES